MDFINQVKAKRKPPPPPPRKPAHLTQPNTSTSTDTRPRPSSKRGIGWPWDFQANLVPLFTRSSSSPQTHHPPPISWLFNWELWVPPGLPSNTTDQPHSTEWIPCVRTAAQCTDITPFLTDITTNQHRTITHFLGFNEPEIPSQANMSVDEAIGLWREYVLPAKDRFKFRLGSPGMSSDVSKSVPWLDEFFMKLGSVGGSRVDFLVVHWYGPRFEDMKLFLETMYQRYKRPLWVNEFACSKMGQGEATVHEVEAFMREAVPWMDACPWIEKYAYYGNGQGMDVGSWVGRASNFTELAPGCEETGGRRLTRIGRLYLDL